jgi:ferredoxin-NADP reductase
VEPCVQMTVHARRQESDGVLSLVLVPVDEAVALPAWEPGAHVDLLGPDLVRQYSLCGDPGDLGSYRVGVLREPLSRGGSAWVHDELVQGARLEVRGPRNHFPLQSADDYLFIAGGIGITPLLPMVREAEKQGARWSLVYGGRSRTSMAFLDELAPYGDRVVVLPQDETGLLDLPALLGQEVPGRQVYCCGPEPLLAAVESAMSGRTAERLHVERFSPRAGLPVGGDSFEVVVASSGASVTVGAEEAIIDALGRIGVDVDFSCREGTCGTCETGLLSGVAEHRDSVLTTEEQAANDCLMICVGRCLEGPLVLDL